MPQNASRTAATKEISDSIDESKDAARIAVREDGRIIFASKAFCRLSNTDPKTISSIFLQDVITFPSDIRTAHDIKPGIYEVRLDGHNHKDSFYFDWLTNSKNQKFLIGSNMPGEEMAAQDLVSQTWKDNEVDQAALFDPLFHLSPDMMIVADESGKIIRANQAALERTGFNENDIIAKRFPDLFEEEERPFIRNILQSLQWDDSDNIISESQCFQGSIQAADDTPLNLEWCYQKTGAYLYAIGKDITPAKRQQTALARREQQLSEAEAIGGMGHWHWTIGQDLFEWSDQLFCIFGVERGAFEPTLANLNAMVHREDIDRVNQAFQRAVIEQNNYDMEFRILQPSGETRYIRCEGRCVLDEDDDVTALYGIMQDMTERILYEQELKAAKETAERAYAAKTQFLANMSHELRTPLNAIIGFSEIMQQQMLGPIGTEKYMEYIDGIHDSGAHLLDIISDILDMSKIEAGKYELDFEEIKLYEIIESAKHMVDTRALEANVKLTVTQAPPEDLKIVADRRAVLQMLLNLLSNAVKFTPAKGKVWIECLARDKHILIKIHDNGIGIPANKLAQITNPFEQVSSHFTRNHEGSGLGLAITKELVELHAGKLLIESEQGEGTTVTLRLPYDAYKASKG